MLKEAMTALDKIHEWFEKYPEAPIVVPRRDWIVTKYQGPTSYQSSVQRKIGQRCREGVGFP